MRETKGSIGYKQVQEYLKKNPGSSESQACHFVGVATSTYGSYKKKYITQETETRPKRKYTKRKPKLETFTVPEISNANNYAVVIVPASSIKQFVKEMWG